MRFNADLASRTQNATWFVPKYEGYDRFQPVQEELASQLETAYRRIGPWHASCASSFDPFIKTLDAERSRQPHTHTVTAMNWLQQSLWALKLRPNCASNSTISLWTSSSKVETALASTIAASPRASARVSSTAFSGAPPQATRVASSSCGVGRPAKD